MSSSGSSGDSWEQVPSTFPDNANDYNQTKDRTTTPEQVASVDSSTHPRELAIGGGLTPPPGEPRRTPNKVQQLSGQRNLTRPMDDTECSKAMASGGIGDGVTPPAGVIPEDSDGWQLALGYCCGGVGLEDLTEYVLETQIRCPVSCKTMKWLGECAVSMGIPDLVTDCWPIEFEMVGDVATVTSSWLRISAPDFRITQHAYMGLVDCLIDAAVISSDDADAMMMPYVALITADNGRVTPVNYLTGEVCTSDQDVCMMMMMDEHASSLMSGIRVTPQSWQLAAIRCQRQQQQQLAIGWTGTHNLDEVPHEVQVHQDSSTDAMTSDDSATDRCAPRRPEATRPVDRYYGIAVPPKKTRPPSCSCCGHGTCFRHLVTSKELAKGSCDECRKGDGAVCMCKCPGCRRHKAPPTSTIPADGLTTAPMPQTGCTPSPPLEEVPPCPSRHGPSPACSPVKPILCKAPPEGHEEWLASVALQRQRERDAEKTVNSKGVAVTRCPTPPPPPPPPPTPPRPTQPVLRPMPVLPTAIPTTATELCLLFGDRTDFTVEGLEIVADRRRDGGYRIGARFHKLSRRGISASNSMVCKFPQVDAQVTLIYTQKGMMPQQRIETIIEELRWRATLLNRAIVMKGLFQASGARPNCAWMDIVVESPGYKVLHDFASVVKGTTRNRCDATWMHPYFSLMIKTDGARFQFAPSTAAAGRGGRRL